MSNSKKPDKMAQAIGASGGAFAGTLVGGPLGTMVGALIGHWLAGEASKGGF
jgi:hypothetical protein